MGSIEGQTAVVTGGGTGVGAAIALRLLGQGSMFTLLVGGWRS